MLSADTQRYLQASVPVLREYGSAITREFYAQLFAAHPELKDLFNLGNQANGAQQGSLAGSLFAYAAHHTQPQALAPVLSRIAHKHASLGVTPAQYPIVGRHLIAAIQTVLGAAATPGLLAAWDEAYHSLAAALITAEAGLYAQAAVEPGSCQTLVVERVERESEHVKSFYLRTAHGASPGAFEPGQYVSVAVQLDSGRRQLRQYSLSDAPTKPYWRITVKAEAATADTPAGQVSNLLHARVKAGDTLRVGAAFGDFVPLRAADPSQPLALLSSGVGVTPLLSVLNTLVERGSERAILFAHTGQAADQALLVRELELARARLPGLHVPACGSLGHAAPPGPIALEAATLQRFRAARFYVSGSVRFVQTQWRALIAAGLSAAQIEREVFGPELFEHLA